MSETYLSTGTMAWPGEKETDFNLNVPVWELLNLPFGPKYSEGLGMKLPSHLVESPTELAATPLNGTTEGDDARKASGEVDWASFDFATADLDAKTTAEADDEIDAFFKNFGNKDGVNKEEEEGKN